MAGQTSTMQSYSKVTSVTVQNGITLHLLLSHKTALELEMQNHTVFFFFCCFQGVIHKITFTKDESYQNLVVKHVSKFIKTLFRLYNEFMKGKQNLEDHTHIYHRESRSWNKNNQSSTNHPKLNLP